MHISNIDYHLPKELIAQHPLPERSESRLLVVHRNDGRIEHRRFSDIEEFFEAGDLLVLNDTRVTPVRLYSRREKSGGVVEVLLLESKSDTFYRAMTGSGGRLVVGEKLKISNEERGANPPSLIVELICKHEDGTWDISLTSPTNESVSELVAKLAKMPLPPYIQREKFDDQHASEDKERYQTVYARQDGAVAAPTAGLHFTQSLLGELSGKGVEQCFVTLHVGPGTFQPVKVEQVEEHAMHEEHFEFLPESASIVNKAKGDGGKIIAVGSTVTRVLESCVGGANRVSSQSGETDLLILPGHNFEIVDALLTNFHLPKSTLLALVMAFASEELIREAYQEAIEQKYRFFSYGDAMLIL